MVAWHADIGCDNEEERRVCMCDNPTLLSVCGCCEASMTLRMSRRNEEKKEQEESNAGGRRKKGRAFAIGAGGPFDEDAGDGATCTS